jgi:hypothetical protein
MKGASQTIRNAIRLLEGVTEMPHRFGGVEFRLGRRELGHLHGDSLLDIPFPMRVRNELIEKEEVLKHHVMPESGWVSLPIKTEDDVSKAIALLQRSFSIAQQSSERKSTPSSSQAS